MRTLMGDWVSLLDEIVAPLSVCAILDLNIDAVSDLAVKSLACKLHRLLGNFLCAL